MNARQLIRFFLISVLFSISLGSTPPLAEAWQAVSAATTHTCGLRNDGTLACWGNNLFGQATPPSGTFTQVAAGEFHTCGLRIDGNLACWGSIWVNNSGDVSSFIWGPIKMLSVPGDVAFALLMNGLCEMLEISNVLVLPVIKFQFRFPVSSRYPAATWPVAASAANSGGLACWGNPFAQELINIPSGAFTQASCKNIYSLWHQERRLPWPVGDENRLPSGRATHRDLSSGLRWSDFMPAASGPTERWPAGGTIAVRPGHAAFRRLYPGALAGDFHTCGLQNQRYADLLG